jgi:hypothetical protein
LAIAHNEFLRVGSRERVPERAKAFLAKAQNRRGRKENKGVVFGHSWRLGVRWFIFSPLPGNQQERSDLMFRC